ncbi:hypothetical protein SAMN05192568_10633 [Methylobacterium pseudosasicola]|uniref:Uncharacterized protein n=1 Tax=Methylobacterium pseudosasicola TaxID=582667 RepID=A0A1I4U410_9HYPH|nr:hypothetical protein SAMN05192568_10633 [Methylobacterium pseudosasicola]
MSRATLIFWVDPSASPIMIDGRVLKAPYRMHPHGSRVSRRRCRSHSSKVMTSVGKAALEQHPSVMKRLAR